MRGGRFFGTEKEHMLQLRKSEYNKYVYHYVTELCTLNYIGLFQNS
jgi:hypothetical protein